MEKRSLMKLFGLFAITFVANGCDLTMEDLGQDRAADAWVNDQWADCDNIYGNQGDEGTGRCSYPELIAPEIKADGENGEVRFTFDKLADGNSPEVTQLSFRAEERKGEWSAIYEIRYSCERAQDADNGRKSIRCVALSAPRLRTSPQAGGNARFHELRLENPSCKATYFYYASNVQCHRGNPPTRVLELPTFGLVPQ